MKKVLTITTAFVAVTGPLFANVGEVDTDGDGVASFTELVAVYPTLTEEGFQAIDVNDDGAVDDVEFAAAQDTGVIPQN